MVKVKPFCGIRPPKEYAAEVASRPYDALNSQEAKAEAAAKAYTAAQKKVTADFNLWSLYDAIKSAKNPKSAQKKYDKAVVKAEKALAKALAQK